MSPVQYAVLAYVVGVGLVVGYGALLWARALCADSKERGQQEEPRPWARC